MDDLSGVASDTCESELGVGSGAPCQTNALNREIDRVRFACTRTVRRFDSVSPARGGERVSDRSHEDVFLTVSGQLDTVTDGR